MLASKRTNRRIGPCDHRTVIREKRGQAIWITFGLPKVKVGVFPMLVTSLLQSIAAPRLINEWVLTGEPFDAKAALAAGLLNYVVPAAELDAKIDWLVGRVVDKSPTAIRDGN